MEPKRKGSGGLANAIRILADLRTATIESLSVSANVEANILIGAIDALLPLGAVQLDPDNFTLSVPSDRAADFLRGYSFLVTHRTVVVDDWHRSGTDSCKHDMLLDRGACLLRAIENRRVSRQNNAETIRSTRVAKAVITAAVRSGDRALLMVKNERVNVFHLIGGPLRPGEDFDTTLRRDLSDQLRQGRLTPARDYEIEQLLVDPVSERFVSPGFGAYTEYIVKYYFIHLRVPLQLSGTLRWVTLSELRSGATVDGYVTIPPPHIFAAHIEKPVLSLATSIRNSVEPIRVETAHRDTEADSPLDLEKMPLGAVLRRLRVGQLWAVLVAIFTILAAVAVVSFRLGGLGK